MKRSIYKILIPLLFCVLPHAATGQQDPLLTQYMFNTLAFNPAYAGTSGMLHAMVTSRHQWIGFDDAPSTQTFTIHTPFTAKSFATGLTFIRDEIGPTANTSAWFDYSYHLNLSRSVKLSLGLKGGFSHYKTDFSKLIAEASPEEAAYFETPEAQMLPNFGFGTYLWSDKFYLGISAPRLLENSVENEVVPGSYTIDEKRIYLLMGGVVFHINQDFVLKPSFMLRLNESSPLSADANLTLFIKDRISAGVFYRDPKSAGGIVSLKLGNQFSVGYAYDTSFDSLASKFGSSHEFMIGFEFSFKKDKVVNPRYF